jgi:hypothetical protein
MSSMFIVYPAISKASFQFFFSGLGCDQQQFRTPVWGKPNMLTSRDRCQWVLDLNYE